MNQRQPLNYRVDPDLDTVVHKACDRIKHVCERSTLP